MTPEGAVKRDIKKALKKLQVYFWMPPQTIYGKTGVSDFIVLYRGRALFIEAKATASSEWTPNQRRFAEDVQRQGCPYWLIHAGTVFQVGMLVRDFMEEIDQCFSESSQVASNAPKRGSVPPV